MYTLIMEQLPNSNEKPESSKIIDEQLEVLKKNTQENIEDNEFLLKHHFELLKGYIEILKDSENWIKEMIAFSKENEEMDNFFKEQGKESSFSSRSYTVEDVERELQNIEKIKSEIKEIHSLITDMQLDTVKEREDLDLLNELEKEFKEMVMRIAPDRLN
jgi:hypothetical protein